MANNPYMTAVVEDDTTWRTQAACATVHPDVWFPGDGQRGIARQAIAICYTCPVIAECLKAGMDETHGIWGGLTPVERKALRRERRGAA